MPLRILSPQPPQPPPQQLKSIVPLAVIHVLGNVLTNVSLGKVAVSFTHTVKAAEPFFSVIMSAIFLGDVPPVPVGWFCWIGCLSRVGGCSVGVWRCRGDECLFRCKRGVSLGAALPLLLLNRSSPVERAGWCLRSLSHRPLPPPPLSPHPAPPARADLKPKPKPHNQTETNPKVLLTLIPIVGGVVLASLTEATFNWTGFLSAMFSNITFQSRWGAKGGGLLLWCILRALSFSRSTDPTAHQQQPTTTNNQRHPFVIINRNVLSKKLMISKGSLDNMNLFQVRALGAHRRARPRAFCVHCHALASIPLLSFTSINPAFPTPKPQIITIMAFFMLMPVQLLIEGGPFLPHRIAELGLSVDGQWALLQKLLGAGLCFHAYQQLSYMILSKVGF